MTVNAAIAYLSLVYPDAAISAEWHCTCHPVTSIRAGGVVGRAASPECPDHGHGTVTVYARASRTCTGYLARLEATP